MNILKNVEDLEDDSFGCIDNFVHLGKLLHLAQKCVKILGSR